MNVEWPINYYSKFERKTRFKPRRYVTTLLQDIKKHVFYDYHPIVPQIAEAPFRSTVLRAISTTGLDQPAECLYFHCSRKMLVGGIGDPL